MLKIRYIISFILFCTMMQGIFANEKEKVHAYMNGNLLVIVKPSSKSISTSEFLTLKIYATASPNQHIIFEDNSKLTELKDAQIKGGYKAFSIFMSSDSKPILTEDLKVMTIRTLVLAPESPGKYLIPGFIVSSVDKSGKELAIESMPLEVKVFSVLPEDQRKLNMKPIALLKDENSSRNLWILILLCIVVLTIFAVIKSENRRCVAVDRKDALISEFHKLRISHSLFTLPELEKIMIEYFTLKYHLSESVPSSSAFIRLLSESQEIDDGEKGKIIALFDSYNTLRYSKALTTLENIEKLYAEFAVFI